MLDRIVKIEESLLEILTSLKSQKELNDLNTEGLKVITSVAESSGSLAKTNLEKFEVIDQKLANKDTEINILNIQHSTLETKIRTLEMRLEILELNNN